jgi:hypothetical protein
MRSVALGKGLGLGKNAETLPDLRVVRRCGCCCAHRVGTMPVTQLSDFRGKPSRNGGRNPSN